MENGNNNNEPLNKSIEETSSILLNLIKYFYRTIS
jgi:hypothetical protein